MGLTRVELCYSGRGGLTSWLFEKPINIARAVNNAMHFDPVFERPIDNQIILEAFDRPQPQLLQMTPAPKLCVEQADFFGNLATFFMVDEPHEQLTVKAVSVTEVTPFTAPAAAHTPPWETVRTFLDQDHSTQGLQACQFVYDGMNTG